MPRQHSNVEAVWLASGAQTASPAPPTHTPKVGLLLLLLLLQYRACVTWPDWQQQAAVLDWLLRVLCLLAKGTL